jgi:hypothetical protein
MDRIPDRPSSPGSPLVLSNRRDFVKKLLLLGGAPLLAKRGLWAAAGRAKLEYQYRTIEFPNFILPSMHNALMGCFRCQDKCPANAPFVASPTRLEDVTEEETEKILNGTPDDALLKSMGRKLQGFGASKQSFPVFTRNLRALLR